MESRISDCLGYPYVGQAATVFNVLTEKKKKRRETKIKEKETEKRKRYTYLMRKNAAIITSIRIVPTRPATIHIKLDLEGSGFWAA